MDRLSTWGIRLVVILVPVSLAFVVFRLVTLQSVLYPTCGVNDDTCLKLHCRRKQNSVLVEVDPMRFWVWFNGIDFLVFSPNMEDFNCSQVSGPLSAPAYRLNRLTGQPSHLVCVDPLGSLIKYYENEEKFVVYKRLNSAQFNLSFRTVYQKQKNEYIQKAVLPTVDAAMVADILLSQRIVQI